MMSKFDIWISRLSQLAQVGLFSLAVFGFFYTVVPIYQKEILTEAIANKELMLSELQNKIHAYNTKALNNSVEWFIIKAATKCTGMLENPEFEKRMNEFLKGNIPGIDPATNFIYTNATDDCLQQLYDEQKLLNMATPESRIKFETELNAIAHNLEKARKHMIESNPNWKENYEIREFETSVPDQLSKLRDINIEAMREE